MERVGSSKVVKAKCIFQSHSRISTMIKAEAKTLKVVVNMVASGTDVAAMTADKVSVASVKSPWASHNYKVMSGC